MIDTQKWFFCTSTTYKEVHTFVRLTTPPMPKQLCMLHSEIVRLNIQMGNFELYFLVTDLFILKKSNIQLKFV